MAHRNLPRPAAVYGIDIGKNVFHVVGLSADGTPVQKVRFRRDTLLQFFARADPARVAVACPQDTGARAQGSADPRAICQAGRQVEQKRHHRR